MTTRTPTRESKQPKTIHKVLIKFRSASSIVLKCLVSVESIRAYRRKIKDLYCDNEVVAVEFMYEEEEK